MTETSNISLSEAEKYYPCFSGRQIQQNESHCYKEELDGSCRRSFPGLRGMQRDPGKGS